MTPFSFIGLGKHFLWYTAKKYYCLTDCWSMFYNNLFQSLYLKISPLIQCVMYSFFFLSVYSLVFPHSPWAKHVLCHPNPDEDCHRNAILQMTTMYSGLLGDLHTNKLLLCCAMICTAVLQCSCPLFVKKSHCVYMFCVCIVCILLLDRPLIKGVFTSIPSTETTPPCLRWTVWLARSRNLSVIDRVQMASWSSAHLNRKIQQ